MTHSKRIFRIRRAATTLGLAASLVWLPQTAAGGILGADRPDAILCDVALGKVVFYADHVNSAGVATYSVLGPTGLALTLQADGIVRSPNGRGSCHGKSVKELREQGDAFDLGGG